MTGEIAVDADVLTAHARKVAGIADDVSTAVGAVRSVALGGGAFGVLCGWMVAPAEIVSDVIATHARASREALERTEQQLHATVADFTELEASHVAALRELGRGLG